MWVPKNFAQYCMCKANNTIYTQSRLKVKC